MSTKPPKQWRCGHCNERVDPTMQLCWNCGRDREGDYDADWYRAVGPGALEACPACSYALIGNTKAIQCPECGMDLPESGFEPEVVLQRRDACPKCAYDLRGSLESASCSECGYRLAAERYETKPPSTKTSAVSADDVFIEKQRRRRLIGCSAMFVLGLPLAGFLSMYLTDQVSDEAGAGVIVFWFIFFLVSVIMFFRSLGRQGPSDSR